jgi:hypothetical protein
VQVSNSTVTINNSTVIFGENNTFPNLPDDVQPESASTPTTTHTHEPTSTLVPTTEPTPKPKSYDVTITYTEINRTNTTVTLNLVFTNANGLSEFLGENDLPQTFRVNSFYLVTSGGGITKSATSQEEIITLVKDITRIINVTFQLNYDLTIDNDMLKYQDVPIEKLVYTLRYNGVYSINYMKT